MVIKNGRNTKAIIEKKNKHITANINYAWRIQNAILPRMDDIRQSFPDMFIFYKPRDIVSGDFYWHAKIGNRHIIAAIDCTGHGVSGAFMSLVGDSYLKHIVNVEKITSPDEILTRMHIGIRSALKQEQTRDNNGMDMAICVVDYESKIMEFAGAVNPLIYVKDNELYHIKGDLKSIGGEQKDKSPKFEKHIISLEQPICFYLFSDGYVDQFGGSKGRKYMIKRFKNFLYEIHNEPMQKQAELLEANLKNWMSPPGTGRSEKKVDDIIVVGIRIGGNQPIEIENQYPQL